MISRLSDNDVVMLHDKNGRIFDFKITARLDDGKGASVFCYRAVRGDMSGILRQVKVEGAAAENYLQPYTLLVDAALESDSIKSFIPQIEIYRDKDERAYVWSNEPVLATFDKLCVDFQKNPQPNAAYNLVLALSAIKCLTQCVCELHRLNLIHRDIKPANFGFVRRAGQVLTQTIVLFDVDTICSAYSRPKSLVYTPGFSDGFSHVDNLTDIYSIGATLFAALIGRPYDDFDYDDLKNLIDNCPIVVNMVDMHVKLKELIVKILRECLAFRDERCESCEQLLVDINAALDYAIPAELQTRMNKAGEQLRWLDVEYFLKQYGTTNFDAHVQNHLFETPLYRWQPKESPNLNVLVIGCGDYAQTFLDNCLTLGQMPNVNLNVTIIGAEQSDFDLYLKNRPALPDFFSIDDEHVEDNYGSIRFECRKLSNAIATDIQDVLCRSDQLPHYIFIALGNTQLNYFAAKACQEAAKALEFKCGIIYVWEGYGHQYAENNLIPIVINNYSRRPKLSVELERMAFNVHLIWEKNLRIDYKKVKADFRLPYNHRSCVLNAVSLKYKLHSLGIDYDQTPLIDCADRLDEIISNDTPANRKLKDLLICCEHRRWVAEKICGGWVRRDVADCRMGITRDARKKNHVCIVHSRPDQMLRRDFTLDEWDKCSSSKLNKLDDLDRMSVDLHFTLSRQAKLARQDNLLNGETVTNLRNLIGDDAHALNVLNEWLSCLEDIWNEQRNAVRLYQSLLSRLKDALKEFMPGVASKAAQYIRSIDDQFKPIRLSMEYRNYKEDDRLLIDEAPFILTYSENTFLAVPFNSGSNTKLFGNIAADAVINAHTIIYLLYVSSEEEAKYFSATLYDDLQSLFAYARKKNLRAKFEFVFAYDTRVLDDEMCAPINDAIEEYNEIIKRITLMPISDDDQITRKFEAYLEARVKAKRLVALEKNSSRLSAIFQGNGLYKRFSSYEFDLNTQTFVTSGRCKVLSYIHKPAHLTIDDLFSFKGSSIAHRDKPDFFGDYKKLWAMYRRSPRTWKKLCEWLKYYEEVSEGKERSKLARLEKYRAAQHDSATATLRYIMPFECRASLEKILNALIDREVIESNSKVVINSANSCKVFINTKAFSSSTFSQLRAEFDWLFGDPYALINSNAIDFEETANTVTVRFDNLIVRDLRKNADPDVNQLLRDLHNMSYVTALAFDGGNVRFTYPTRQIKRLLTQEGKILEIYVYHKLLASGLFDEVSCNCEVTWQDTGAKNEFDCIATSGFNSFFIECKARIAIEAEFYYKLNSLVQQFGINARAIMVADTLEREGTDLAELNEMQSQRGELQNILTIRKPEDIDEIDRVLSEMI
ncbi:MAG: DUF1887 family protein [Selenomonadaceae bacterium]|nr:DUF1887 family protein [Selenomonadaceae bacterium]